MSFICLTKTSQLSQKMQALDHLQILNDRPEARHLCISPYFFNHDLVPPIINTMATYMRPKLIKQTNNKQTNTLFTFLHTFYLCDNDVDFLISYLLPLYLVFQHNLKSLIFA